MNAKSVLTTLLLASSFAAAAPALAEPPALIPRDVLFGNPERTSPHLSPDGKHLAWLAPDKKNVLQVWVKTIGKKDDKMVTADKKRGIRSYFWAEDDRTLLYIQDADGDENWHVYGVDLPTGSVRDYTPFQRRTGSTWSTSSTATRATASRGRRTASTSTRAPRSSSPSTSAAASSR